MAARGVVNEELVEVADGIALRVLVRGRGEGVPFLLVHGLASNAHLWDGVGDELARLGHPSAAVDLRGHGPRGRAHVVAPDGFAFAAVIADLATVVTRLGWDRPVAVGQSWGGNVVVELAAFLPEAVRGIACVDGGTIELSNHFADFDACSAAMAPPPLTGTPAEAIERYLRDAHPHWPETGIAGQLANFEVRADGTVVPWLTFDRHMAILRGLFEHHPSQRWPALGASPVLLIPADNASSPSTKQEEVAAAEAALEHSRVHWIKGDHDLHAQYPNEIAALLHDACADGFFA